jgi:threonine dehydrogenase-like Zn-dependent dehydrogenase
METTCSDWGIAQALRIAAIGGRVALTGGGPLNLGAWDLVYRDLTVFGSKAGYQQEQALRLIEAGRLDLKAAVTHRWPLSRAPEAFELLAGPGRADVGRILFEIHES